MARRIIKVGSLFMLHLYSVKVENNWILLYNQYIHNNIRVMTRTEGFF